MKHLLVGLVFFGVFQAHAQESSPHLKNYNRCVDANAPINNTVVYQCAEDTSVAAKADINRYYKQISARLATQPQDLAALEQAQKAWIVYRDKHCALATTYVGSPMSSFCPMQINAQRAEQLKELAGD